jgi:molecular chaperone DnaK
LNKQEVEKMTKDAEAHAAEDKKRREVIDLKNQADQLVYSTEKTVKEHGEKVSADTRGKIESAMNNLKEAAKGEDGDAIKKAMENLSTTAQELGKILYEEAAKKQGGAKQPGNAASEPKNAEGEVHRKGGDDVIDAEFEAKDKQ